MEQDVNAEVFSRMNALRRGLHLHSVLYYHYHQPLISDAAFDERTAELLKIQAEHPTLAVRGYAPQVFKGWNGNTGMHFPKTDYIIGLAAAILLIAKQRGES